MDSFIVWLIIALFFAPLHYLIPILVVVLNLKHPDEKSHAVKTTIIDCTISMLIGFGAIFLFFMDDLEIAILILLLAFISPYIWIFLIRREISEG